MESPQYDTALESTPEAAVVVENAVMRMKIGFQAREQGSKLATLQNLAGPLVLNIIFVGVDRIVNTKIVLLCI